MPNETRPAPYPADTLSKGWRFELNMEKVKKSDTWLRARNGLTRARLLLLWAESWEQTPCGSLPNDDELLALLLDMDAETFAKHRAVLMRGWWLAEDGRLYHDYLTANVLRMLDARSRHLHLKHRAAVIARCGEMCWYCKAAPGDTLDHIIPRAQGGTDDPDNLVPACRPCNSSKGARTPEEWRG